MLSEVQAALMEALREKDQLKLQLTRSMSGYTLASFPRGLGMRLHVRVGIHIVWGKGVCLGCVYATLALVAA